MMINVGFLLSFLAITPFVSLAAQSASYFEITTNYEQKLYRMATDGYSVLVVGGDSFCSRPIVQSFDAEQGTFRWQQYTPLPSGNAFGWHTDVVYAGDGTYWVTGYSRYADDVGGNQMLSLYQMDTTGNLLQQLHRPASGDGEGSPNPQVALSAAGEVLWLAGDTLLVYASSGTLLQSAPLPFVGQQLAVGNHGQVALMDQWGAGMVLDTDLSVRSEWSAGTLSNASLLFGEEVWLANSSRVLTIDPTSGAVIQTINLDAPSGLSALMAMRGEQVFVYTPFGGYLVSPQGAVNQQFTQDLADDRSFVDLLVSAENYLLLGADENGDGNNTLKINHDFLARQPLSSPLPLGTDLTIDTIEAVLINAEALPVSNPDLPATRVIFDFELDFTVRNAGPDTVFRQFRLYSEDLGGFNCVRSRRSHTISLSAPLLPGDTLHMRQSYRQILPFYDVPPPDTVRSTLDICFFTAQPDRLLDAKPENDWACAAGQALLVETNEQLAVKDWSFFPNPATEQITFVNLPPQVAHCEVYNLSGQLVHRAPLAQSLAVSHFKAGLYHLRLRTTTGHYLPVTRRLLVVH
ncbi:MAG: T9SS C-terminal target domain-containing protein [Bacteroidetes bacterium]|nr:MAG: T9SS C-terminal target domain-containing protein [Bacteroidota bacterium]